MYLVRGLKIDIKEQKSVRTHFVRFFLSLRIRLEGGVVSESGDRSGNVVSSDERHDGDHSKASVIELCSLFAGHDVLSDVGEVDGGENHGGKRTSLSVVHRLRFSDEFGDETSEEDLGLPRIGDRRPRIERLHDRK